MAAAPGEAINAHVLVPALFLYTLKPVWSLEVGVQAKSISQEDTAEAELRLGALGGGGGCQVVALAWE